ncbi:MAG: FAD-dependent oxidoreductase [Planctomycetaceae bacterium]|nr:MAG: FAD-dependent oxidoreductase [Planctomycetaceae bacterium]
MTNAAQSASPQRPRGANNRPSPRVGIVGGGLAGLASAMAIHAAAPDAQITLFESRRQTGGRAGSFIDPQTGEEVDYCQHVAMGCCTNLLNLLDDCGLGDTWDRYDELTFHYPGRPSSRFSPSRWLPAPLHLLPTLGRLNYLSRSQKIEIGRGTWRLMRESTASLRGSTAAQWLRDAGQSAATIRDYWDVVLVSALGESSETVSMAPARKVFVDGFLANRHAGDVLVPRLPLAELFGRRLPDRLRATGIELRTGTPVRRIRLPSQDEPNERGSIILEFAGETIQTDQIVLAVPWHQVDKLVDPDLARRAGLKPAAWNAFSASPISGVHLWFDRSLTAAPHAVLVGTLAQWMFRRPNPTPTHDPPNAGHYLQVVISASRSVRSLTAEQVIRQVVDDLLGAFPQTPEPRLLAARVVTDPQAVFSVSPAVEMARPASKTEFSSLHLAGDFVQTGWPATMEGAVISGRQAANSLLEAIGRPSTCLTSPLRPGTLARWLIRN